MLDILLFGALPYVAVVLLVGVSIRRYLRDPFTFSSLSSQFLESRRLFWGSVPFHLGIIFLFFGHVVGFLIPSGVTLWNGVPWRLLVLESAALAAALLALVGLAGLIFRRADSSRLRANTTVLDILVYVCLLFQVITGLWIALDYRWGSSWYVHTAVPYLWSILQLSPDIQRVAELPLIPRLHIIGAFTLFSLFSFTRLVHILVAPVPYLWRPVQLVIWNRARKSGRA